MQVALVNGMQANHNVRSNDLKHSCAPLLSLSGPDSAITTGTCHALS